ncbi:MAG: GIY-YIG nuclease family protein [Selenomonadaceae bacterium]|nr:GIY-YIG nuclease family protein [Selenomonadaceae bacterium]
MSDSEKNQMSGIYMLVCRVNGKRYIGQSKNIKRCLNDHKWNKRCTSIISKAIAKYGWDAFDKEILEFCPVEELDEKEIYYIAKIKPEYNVSKGGKFGLRGFKHSKSFGEKISKALIRSQNGAKKVINVETGEIFNSIKNAAESVGKSRDVIWRALYGRIKTAGGYHWKFLSEYDEHEILGDEKPYRKTVMCIETGEIFPSARAAAKYVGVSFSLISIALHGKCKTAGGFRWKFANADTPQETFYKDTRKKSVICVETGEIFPTIKAAADILNLKNPASISGALHGRAKTAGGYHWKYTKEID